MANAPHPTAEGVWRVGDVHGLAHYLLRGWQSQFLLFSQGGEFIFDLSNAVHNLLMEFMAALLVPERFHPSVWIQGKGERLSALLLDQVCDMLLLPLRKPSFRKALKTRSSNPFDVLGKISRGEHLPARQTLIVVY